MTDYMLAKEPLYHADYSFDDDEYSQEEGLEYDLDEVEEFSVVDDNLFPTIRDEAGVMGAGNELSVGGNMAEEKYDFDHLNLNEELGGSACPPPPPAVVADPKSPSLWHYIVGGKSDPSKATGDPTSEPSVKRYAAPVDEEAASAMYEEHRLRGLRILEEEKAERERQRIQATEESDDDDDDDHRFADDGRLINGAGEYDMQAMMDSERYGDEGDDSAVVAAAEKILLDMERSREEKIQQQQRSSLTHSIGKRFSRAGGAGSGSANPNANVVNSASILAIAHEDDDADVIAEAERLYLLREKENAERIDKHSKSQKAPKKALKKALKRVSSFASVPLFSRGDGSTTGKRLLVPLSYDEVVLAQEFKAFNLLLKDVTKPSNYFMVLDELVKLFGSKGSNSIISFVEPGSFSTQGNPVFHRVFIEKQVMESIGDGASADCMACGQLFDFDCVSYRCGVCSHLVCLSCCVRGYMSVLGTAEDSDTLVAQVSPELQEKKLCRDCYWCQPVVHTCLRLPVAATDVLESPKEDPVVLAEEYRLQVLHEFESETLLRREAEAHKLHEEEEQRKAMMVVESKVEKRQSFFSAWKNVTLPFDTSASHPHPSSELRNGTCALPREAQSTNEDDKNSEFGGPTLREIEKQTEQIGLEWENENKAKENERKQGNRRSSIVSGVARRLSLFSKKPKDRDGLEKKRFSVFRSPDAGLNQPVEVTVGVDAADLLMSNDNEVEGEVAVPEVGRNTGGGPVRPQISKSALQQSTRFRKQLEEVKGNVDEVVRQLDIVNDHEVAADTAIATSASFCCWPSESQKLAMVQANERREKAIQDKHRAAHEKFFNNVQSFQSHQVRIPAASTLPLQLGPLVTNADIMACNKRLASSGKVEVKAQLGFVVKTCMEGENTEVYISFYSHMCVSDFVPGNIEGCPYMILKKAEPHDDLLNINSDCLSFVVCLHSKYLDTTIHEHCPGLKRKLVQYGIRMLNRSFRDDGVISNFANYSLVEVNQAKKHFEDISPFALPLNMPPFSTFNDVVVLPTPGVVLKCKFKNRSSKLFINVCHHESAPIVSLDAMHFVNSPVETFVEKGDTFMVLDVIMHTKQWDALRDFVTREKMLSKILAAVGKVIGESLDSKFSTPAIHNCYKGVVTSFSYNAVEMSKTIWPASAFVEHLDLLSRDAEDDPTVLAEAESILLHMEKAKECKIQELQLAQQQVGRPKGPIRSLSRGISKRLLGEEQHKYEDTNATYAGSSPHHPSKDNDMQAMMDSERYGDEGDDAAVVAAAEKILLDMERSKEEKIQQQRRSSLTHSIGKRLSSHSGAGSGSANPNANVVNSASILAIAHEDDDADVIAEAERLYLLREKENAERIDKHSCGGMERVRPTASSKAHCTSANQLVNVPEGNGSSLCDDHDDPAIVAEAEKILLNMEREKSERLRVQLDFERRGSMSRRLSGVFTPRVVGTSTGSPTNHPKAADIVVVSHTDLSVDL